MSARIFPQYGTIREAGDIHISQSTSYFRPFPRDVAEGPGSIMSYVKAKGWANGLSARTSLICPGSPGEFSRQIELTEEVYVTKPSALNDCKG